MAEKPCWVVYNLTIIMRTTKGGVMLLPGGRIDMTGRAQGTWIEFPEAALIRHEEEKRIAREPDSHDCPDKESKRKLRGPFFPKE